MNPATLPAWLILASLLALAGSACLHGRRWRAGRPGGVDLWRGLLAAPRRYLVQVHEAVSRDPVDARHLTERGRWSAALHILSAGGLAAATVLIPLVHGPGPGGRTAAWLLLLVLAGMLAGAGLAAGRRWRRQRPARLSGGGFDRLPAALAAYAVAFGVMTLPLVGPLPALPAGSLPGLLILALALWACLELYPGMARRPMKHALAGALHLAAHPRPARFRQSTPDSGLRALDLESDPLGSQRATDFPWNRLLAFDACVECGRCETACPAHAAGLPLNPKALIQDLARAAGCTDDGDHGSGHGDRPARRAVNTDAALVGDDAVIHPDTLWACTTCRACVYECPMMIEHVDAVIDLRRFETLERGSEPQSAANLLEELRATDTIGGRSPARRLDWASDLGLPLLSGTGSCDVLLWLGESAFELRNQRTLRALVHLLRAAGVDFAVLGGEELDCGDLARRLGDEATFQDLARRNIATLERYRFREIVTADPHALHTLANEYPELGGRYTVRHHTTLLAELLDQGLLGIRRRPPADSPVTYHDPCYLGRYNGETAAPRRILEALGLELREMERAGMRSMCCGAGGGMAVTDIPGRRRIADVRMDQVRATGAGRVAVACPNCAVMLEGVVEPRPAVTDVAELLLDAVEGT